MPDNTKLAGIKQYDVTGDKLKQYHSPHSELGMVPLLQDISRWNGSSFDRVKEWLESGQPVYTSFSKYVPVLKN